MGDANTSVDAGVRGDAAVAALLRARGTGQRHGVDGPDGAAESAAMARLAQQLADRPQDAAQDLAEMVLAWCGAAAAVVEVLEEHEHQHGQEPDGAAVRWCAAAGSLAPYRGARWALADCPAGAAILAGAAVLFEGPVPGFASLRTAGLAAGEMLALPWRLQGGVRGAVLALLPQGERFDAADLRRLGACAAFAAAAWLACEAHGAGAGELERRLEERLRPVLAREAGLQREVEESRAAERVLREHKALIEATLRIGTVGVLYFDLDGTVRDVNNAFERMTGYTCAELRRLGHWTTLSPPDFWAVSADALRDLAAGGATAPYTKQMKRKDGSRWWGLFAPARISGSGQCVMFVLDVSEHKEIEARLLESEEKFRAMVEGFAEAVWEADADGQVRQASPTWSAYTGQSAEESLGDGWLQAVHPQDRAMVQRAWRTAVGMRRTLNVEFRVQVARGGWRWTNAHAAPLFSADGALRKWAGMHIDIDERRRAQAALAESERRYRMLFEAMDEGFLLAAVGFDTAGCPAGLVYAEANPAAMRMVEIVYAGPGRLKAHPAFEPCWLDTCAEVARTGVAARDQCFTPALSCWFDFFVYPVGAKEQQRVAILFHDITVRKQAEEALLDADRRKDEFLATLAHELRNPLAPISNAVQLMRRPDGRRQSDRVVEMVGRQVRQIVRLVDDLMEVSRITRGKIDLRLERLPFSDIVGSAVETSQLMIERAGHQLSVALPEEPLCLEADRVRLTQVFANLLNNAAKYTDPGGRIWFDIRREGAQLVASVRDTGIGIPQEALPRVFDMFAQAHRAVGRGQGGLGIGLTMVRSLVEMHHGTVEARSGGPGQGSEFVVRLPLAPDGPVAAAAPQHGHDRLPAPLGGQRILVVDDNRDAADTLALLLEVDGAEVRVAYDGRSALATAATFLPSSILLDLGMPGMDGYEVARQLREDERHAGMRIIALTGWGQDADRRQTRNRGFSHHLTKPVSLEELHQILVDTN